MVEKVTEIYQKLKDIVSKKFISNNPIVRHAYSRNVDPVLHGVPEIVIRPKDAKEISEVIKIANDNNVTVIPRGGGDCEFGGSKPVGNEGIVLDMKRMNNIIELDEDNLIVTAEAGISWGKLNEYLCHYGLYTGCMGPGSGMTASIGGGISHHSVGGGGCAKYGACTNQLVGLQVVLPTGEIIETGSRSNKYAERHFNRFGGGPDLMGLFCGDNGILGVKTQVSLQVFPRPPYAEYKTYNLPRKGRQVSSQIFTDIRKKGIDVYDAMYIYDIIIRVGCENGMFPLWEDMKRKRGVMFYTIEANSEAELDEKVKQLDSIFLEHKCEPFGHEIEDGNIAKWHYVEQGHWQFYHNLWGMMPGLEPLTAECFTPIMTYPKVLDDIDQWDMEHNDDMKVFVDVTGQRPISGSGPILLIDGCNVELTCGFTSFGSYYDGELHEEFDEANLRLWKSFLERVAKWGVQWYMMGEFASRFMVDFDVYVPEYYNLMKDVKDKLDPKHILSRGKFNFRGEDK
ncbi:MAG: FAD-binding protein [Candidatus Lokiarchaeota archaeon]|nr:FAD-binding protein [Candidatus Lokiarchaeota archaeon]MBD3343255.1 FAD-binding protein [Candidatus Lokiarchaeota archaeon]